MRKILVTSALPYANGHIHVGHLVEYLQTDIWVRFQKMKGNECIYICADDAHGTAITIRSKNENKTEEQIVNEMMKFHKDDFHKFLIEFDQYGSTHSDANKEICEYVWNCLKDKGLIESREINQLFDIDENLFLSDRFVRGTCPVCKSYDQPGDNCGSCGSTYSPTDLISPISTLSNKPPIIRSCKHLFVKIEKFHNFIEDWIESGVLPKESCNYIKNYFLNDTLKDWDVSRPEPYFGFQIPECANNYWYVWFDAPIGYISTTKEWCDKNNEDLDSWWRNQEVEIHHFIGKDIQYFHSLFWPVMLKSSNFQLPKKIHIHGFLTVNGEKMSKSKGTFVKASTYLKYLDPSYLRYYYASKLSSKVEDINLNQEEFISRVNSDLVGKVINIASRTAKFIENIGLSDKYPNDEGLFKIFVDKGYIISQCYEKCDYSKAMKYIIELADLANPYVESKAPWILRKDESKIKELQDVCTVSINLFRILVIYLYPVLPDLRNKTEILLNEKISSWDQSKTPLIGQKIAPFKHMMQRLNEKDLEKVISESISN